MDRFRNLVEQLSAKRWFLPVLVLVAVGSVAVLGIGGYSLMSQNTPSASNGPTPGPSGNDTVTGTGFGPFLDPNVIDPVNGKKFSYIYLQLFDAYGKGGPQAAEAEARRLGLLDDEGVHATLILTRPYDEELGGRFRRAGITIEAAHDNVVQVTFPMAKLLEVQASGDTSFVKDLIRFEEISDIQPPIKGSTGRQPDPRPGDPPLPAPPAAFGDRPVEGVKRTGADVWHAANIKGRGMKVGIIDTFKDYQQLLGKQLPANTIAKDFSGKGFTRSNSNHGTSCAQIVHEMAPEAQLYLAHTQLGQAELLAAFDWLIAEKVDVISFSVGNFLFPWDGKSSLSKKVDEAKAKGIVVAVSAANSAQDVYLSKTTGPGVQDLSKLGESSGLRLFSVKGYEGGTIFLTWQNPGTELAIRILDGSTKKELAVSKRTQSTGTTAVAIPMPDKVLESWLIIVEQLSGPPTTFRLLINGDAYFSPYYRTASGSITEPAAAVGSIAVAAAEVATDQITMYSSWGPTLDGRWKPDIAAPTHVGTVFDKNKPTGFNGTSAAAPHVAGAAALVKSRFPNYTVDQITKFLLDNSVVMKSDSMTGMNVVGVGRLALPDPKNLR